MEKLQLEIGNVKIMTTDIEEKALSQLYQLVEQNAFQNSKVRIMPDVHAGAGCVIGFTADLGDKIIPNIVGVDIGCGMHVVELGKVDIDVGGLNYLKVLSMLQEPKLYYLVPGEMVGLKIKKVNGWLKDYPLIQIT